MYNEKQKTRYLDHISPAHPKKYIENITSAFNKTAPFEIRLEKDLCDFSAYDIQNMYSQLSYNSKYTLATFHSYLKSYVTWCEENFIIKDGINHFMEYTISALDAYVDKQYEKRKYITREDLNKMLMALINPRDAFIFICLFEFGKSAAYKEIMELKLSDLDGENLTANLCTGRKVKISRRLYEVAVDADKEIAVYPINGTDVLRKMVYKYRTDYIVKFYMSDASDNALKFIPKLIKDNVRSMGAYSGISSNTLVLSGQIDMIKRRSSELGITPKEYILNYLYEIEDQYGDIKKNPLTYYHRVEDYL